MRHSILSVLLLSVLCPAANGSFVLSYHISHQAPYDVYTFQVVEQGTDTGTNIVALDCTLQAFVDPRAGTPGHLIMKAYDAQGNQPSRIDDLDVSNLADISPTDRSYIRAGPADQWTIVNTTPPYLSPDDPGPANLNAAPWTDTTVPQFEVEALAGWPHGGVPDTTPQTIAVAVVPAGEWVNINGLIGGDVGNAQQVLTAFVPEPSCLAMGLLGAAGICVRRRHSANAA